MYEVLGHPVHVQPSRPRKEPKVSILFRQTEELQHSGGINALALSEDGNHLFTGSRDATVKRWSVAAAHEQRGEDQTVVDEATAGFLGHCDWVNDVALLGVGLIASCSSDRTIHVSSTKATGESRMLASLNRHSDYVMALAVAGPTSAPVLASAGLRAEVFLWDVVASMKIYQQDGRQQPLGVQGIKGSVYAVAMDAMGTLLVAGSPESAIRVSDPRTGAKAFKLRGHTDNIRCLKINAEGTLCLSGSSDNTVRLWDLGQQRCLHTYAVHTDSVWALQATRDFSTAFSGGRDGCAYRTHLEQCTSELLFQEPYPITSLALDRHHSLLWAGTPSSEVHAWHLPAQEGVAPAAHAAPESPSTSAPAQGPQTPAHSRAFPAATSPVMRSRQTFESGSTPTALQSSARAKLRGVAPLVACTILPDKQKVLTQGLDGAVSLWDVTMASSVQAFGPDSHLAAVEQKLFRPAHVPAWFSADCKLGSLAIHLETPSAFCAETYAIDIGFDRAADDLKLNYGEHLLKAAFAAYVREVEATWVSQGRGTPPDAAATSSQFFELADGVVPLVMSEHDDSRTGERQPWARPVSELGAEEAAPLIPRWVHDAVVCSTYPQNPDLKCAFFLVPAEDSGLPSMQHPRLNAPRILRLQKVATYTQGRLHEQGYRFSLAPVFWDAAAAAAHPPGTSTPAPPQENGTLTSRSTRSISPAHSSSSDSASAAQELELVCADQAVPLDISLAAVKAYIWRRPDDMRIMYRPRDPTNPAPLPRFRPSV